MSAVGSAAVHHCEEWQMMDSAKGGRYCGACGDHEPSAQVSPEAAVEASAWNVYKTLHPGSVATRLEHVGGPMRRESEAIARAALEAAAPHMTVCTHDDTQGEK